MLPPKYTFVALAGQNAWHTCAGLNPPRAVIGKYLPSQLRTQKAGPEPAVVTGRGAGAGCWFRPNGSKKPDGAGAWRCFCWGAKKKSNRPSAEAICGVNATVPASITPASSARRTPNSVRNTELHRHAT